MKIFVPLVKFPDSSVDLIVPDRERTVLEKRLARPYASGPIRCLIAAGGSRKISELIQVKSQCGSFDQVLKKSSTAKYNQGNISPNRETGLNRSHFRRLTTIGRGAVNRF